jgi:YGGT family
MQEALGNTMTTRVTSDRPAYSVRAEQAVWLLTGVVDALLVIRFAFKLLAASSQASFVTFIYNLTDVFVAPFHGIFNTAANGRNAFEPESLVAIVVYSLIGWGLAKLVRITTKAGAPTS